MHQSQDMLISQLMICFNDFFVCLDSKNMNRINLIGVNWLLW